jgi:hypothetical protein
MANRYQQVQFPIPFGGGVDTQTDPKAVAPVRLLDLQNGVFSRETSIIKRNGYTALGQDVDGDPGIVYEDPDALAARDDELVLFASGRAYSHRPATDTWSDAGPALSVVASELPLVKTGTIQSQPDAATNGGVTIAAWEDSRGGVWWALLEAETQRILRAPEQMDASGVQPRCLAVGQALHLLWTPTGAGSINIAVINPATPTATPTPMILTGDLSISQRSYDAIPTDGLFSSNPAIVVWARAAGGYVLGYIHESGVIGSAITGLDPPVTDAAAIVSVGPIVAFGGATTVAVTWHDTGAGNTNTQRHDTAAALAALGGVGQRAEGAVPVRLASAMTSAGVTLVWREFSAALNRDHLVRVLSFDGLTTSQLVEQRGAGLASRAFIDADVAHAWLVHDVTFFAVYLCHRVEVGGDAAIVSRTMPTTATGLPTRAHLPSVTSAGRVHSAPLTYHEQLDTPGGDQFGEAGIRAVSLDFDNMAGWQSSQLGRGLYLAAACPLHYDGDRWAEWGFHYAPDDIVTPTLGTGGSLTASSTYLYVVAYEGIDAQGEIHQGAVSAGTTVVLGPGQHEVTIALPMLRATSWRRVRLGVYRSDPGDPTVLRRVSSVDPSATGANGYVLNDPTVDTFSFNDRMSDLDWADQEPLYTNGGIISNDPAPVAGGAMAVGKNRLFWTDPADPHLVRFSQELREGFGVEMAAPLFLRVDPYGGRIVGLSILDDVVIVFKESAIYAFAGAGPLADPTVETNQFSFTPAQLVTSDVGLEAVGTLGYTPVGLVFQTGKGIYLLDRSRQVRKVGAPVDLYAEQLLTRTVLLPDRSQIVFLSSEGRTLLWDYEHDQWSTFTNHTGWDAIVVAGSFHYLRTDGRVFKETPGVYADDNLQIRLLLDTAWIKLAGYLQGWSQVHEAHFLGRFVSDHTLRVHVRLDYEDGYGEPYDLDVTADHDAIGYGEGDYGEGPYAPDSATSTVYQRVIHIGEACEAIAFRLEDIEPTADRGGSFELSELLLTGAILAPSFRLPDSRRS